MQLLPPELFERTQPSFGRKINLDIPINLQNAQILYVEVCATLNASLAGYNKIPANGLRAMGQTQEPLSWQHARTHARTLGFSIACNFNLTNIVAAAATARFLPADLTFADRQHNNLTDAGQTRLARVRACQKHCQVSRPRPIRPDG